MKKPMESVMKVASTDSVTLSRVAVVVWEPGDDAHDAAPDRAIEDRDAELLGQQAPGIVLVDQAEREAALCIPRYHTWFDVILFFSLLFSNKRRIRNVIQPTATNPKVNTL